MAEDTEEVGKTGSAPERMKDARSSSAKPKDKDKSLANKSPKKRDTCEKGMGRTKSDATDLKPAKRNSGAKSADPKVGRSSMPAGSAPPGVPGGERKRGDGRGRTKKGGDEKQAEEGNHLQRAVTAGAALGREKEVRKQAAPEEQRATIVPKEQQHRHHEEPAVPKAVLDSAGCVDQLGAGECDESRRCLPCFGKNGCDGSLVRFRPDFPKLRGHHSVGCFRMRLPAAPGSGLKRGLLCQVTYPAALHAHPLHGVADTPFYRKEVIDRLSRIEHFPRWIGGGLMGGQPMMDPPREPKVAQNGAWPLLILSSGLYATCELYTQFCRELASEGMIVLALEHEDGSGTYAVSRKDGRVIEFVETPQGANIAEFRKPFLHVRSQELTETLQAVSAVIRGELLDAEDPMARVLRLAAPHHIVLCGHSFGAAHIFHYLQRMEKRGEKLPCLGAVLMDTWVEALDFPEQTWKLRVPFCLLVSWMFSLLPSMSPNLEKIAKSNREHCLTSNFLRGTFHQWITDANLALPSFLLRVMLVKGPADFERALRATTRAIGLTVHSLRDQHKAADLAKHVLAVDTEVVCPFG